jgi:hypothetical protein
MTALPLPDLFPDAPTSGKPRLVASGHKNALNRVFYGHMFIKEAPLGPFGFRQGWLDYSPT